jgi:hypothetical protein
MLIPAKYNGKCAGCGDPVVIGEQISWTRGSSAVFHSGCSTEGQAAAKAAQASRATDADIELACPAGLEYMPFQRAGIAFALSVGKARRGVLFGDAPGLGKTIQVLGWINNEPEIDSVLVICPKSLTINWMREARKWLTRDFKVSCVPGCGDVVVMSYEGAKKYAAQLDRRWGLVVVDEAHYCFPFESRVMTDHGELEIGRIVSDRLPVKVLSWNSCRNALEWRRVVNWWKNPADRMVTIRHEHGEIRCTRGHKIWTSRGYIEAERLQSGDSLRSLRGAVPVLGGATSEKTASVLPQQLRGEMENAAAGATRAGSGSTSDCGKVQDRPQIPEVGRENANEQSYVRSEIQGENDNQSNRSDILGSRRERKDDGAAASFGEGVGQGLADGIANIDMQSEGELRVSSLGIQARYCQPKDDDCDRGGRQNTPSEKMEILGSEKRVSVMCSRVVSVSLYEPTGGDELSRGGERDSFSYDLEVEGNHNYFCESVLVSNCKNPKAQRSKAVAAIVAKASRRALLTGTPIPNRPIELFPLMAMVDPAEWDPNGKGFFRFALRYAAAHNSTGYWDFSGASNLDELQQRLRSTNMIRRTKEQVLTELPKKRRQVIELPANGATKAVEAEKAAWDRLESRLEDLRAAVELSKASDDPADFDLAVRALSGATKTAFTEISKQRHAVALAKVPHVIEHATTCLEDADGKLLIWVHHHDVGDAIREGLAAFGVVGIDGRNSSEERDAAVQRFQTDPNVRVFVGGISAAGVGLTLTASAHEIFAELDWVPGNMLQAEDRAHRIGQLESVLVQMMVLEGSLDARMAAVLVEKMAVAEAGLDADTRRTPTLPTAQPPATAGTVRELAAVAAKLSAADVVEVHGALRRLAGLCDGAAAIDGQGFSKIDVRIGHSLANAPRLSPKQAALGVKLCRKYRKQLGEGCWSNL